MHSETRAITMESIVSRREDLLTSALSESEMVLLNIERGAYFAMELVAKRIWDLLAEPRRVADLCEALLTRFAVDRDTCQRELLHFLTEMHQGELIVVTSPGDPGTQA